MIVLDFEVAFREVPARFHAAVDGATTEVAVDANGSTCASILFMHELHGGRLVIRRSGFGLVGGKQVAVTPELVQRVRFANFFTYRGVRSGRNVLTFRLDQSVGGLVRYVRFLPDSGLRIQRAGPLGYRVVLQANRPRIANGRTMEITATIGRVSGMHPHTVVFSIEYPRVGLRLDGDPRRTIAWRSGKTTFALTGLQPGTWPIFVRADAAGTIQAASTVVRVGARRGGASTWLTIVLPALIGAATLLGAVLLILRRRRG